ncbi:TPA: hypothetical protein M4731_000929 [Salmonella enterica]|uniref:Multiple antibiotic resistance protein MarB n=1 Tax=Yokenella regensburgei TaxID=158877 RepID=A0AB38FZ44_9ENTR|nr:MULTISPECIES: hypothetical protein [Enterobacteriaceae]MCH5722905.1 hypothetical protein [Salmonella enterica]KFD23018.1 hypothetical protein GYRE_02548 [Yokenella regensburgei ATCC 49455]MCH5735996.1 hypothetical protein [Salmonella enterica]MCH5741737.1 hypothetical protein [Salmonella enterica]MCH5745719.1 hypothetical protein [Salmonella enterica]
MRQLSAAVVVAFLFGFSAVAADMPADSTHSSDTSAPTRPPLVFGPGPVINPENSQYLEDKNAAMKKDQQEPATQQPSNPHRRLHHGLIPPDNNQ